MHLYLYVDMHMYINICICLSFLDGASGKETTCQCKRRKRRGFSPWSGRSPGVGHGHPLQYSCQTEEPGGLQSIGSQTVGHN